MPPLINRITEWLFRREVVIPDYVALPQDDQDPGARRNAVDRKRTAYKWSIDPRTDTGYVADLSACGTEWLWSNFIHHHYGFFKAYRIAVQGLASLILSKVCGDPTLDPEGNPIDEPFRKYIDIYRYNFLPLPSVAYRWRRDTEFARQCLNGADPTRIFRVTASNFPPNFPCTDDTVRGLLPEGTTLASLISANRLYMINLTWMDGYPMDEGHYTCAPIILFWVNERKTLMPLAIQLFQDPKDGPIFTPLDPPGLWQWVKMHAQGARITLHGPCTHLYNAHLIFEMVYIAMQRNLDLHHPILAMLKPHYWHHLNVNDSARKKLIIPNGILTTLVGYEGFLFSMRNCNKYVSFNDIKIHTDLKNRGLDNTEDVLPDFYWRDDSLRIWALIERYVTNICNIVYPRDDLIEQDMELQGWVRELHTPKPYGCGLATGLPCDPDGRIRSRAHLVEFLTLTIFGVTAYHDGVNDGHGDIVSYIPNQPMSFVKPPPSSKVRDIPEQEMVDGLAGVHDMLLQLALTKSLTNLGDETFAKIIAMTNPFPAGNPELARTFASFKDDLEEASKAIKKRNLAVDFGYTSMDPTIMRSSILQ